MVPYGIGDTGVYSERTEMSPVNRIGVSSVVSVIHSTSTLYFDGPRFSPPR